MKKIVIIGNSAAGFAAAKTLAQNKTDFEVTIISKNKYPCYRKDLLVDYFGGSLQEGELFLAADDFYRDNAINLIKEAEVVRIDTKRQNVVLKDKNKIAYDFLVIASGEKVKLPDIPGKTKEGIFAVDSLDSIKEINNKLLIVNTACVVGDNDITLRLAKILADKTKEVKIIGKINFLEQLQEKIELIDNALVQEIIGESKEVQALKLDSGKAIGTDLILFVGNRAPESDFLKDTDFQLENGYIVVDDNLSLGRGNIFACGSVAKKTGVAAVQKSWDEAGNEGVLVEQNIINNLKEQEILHVRSLG